MSRARRCEQGEASEHSEVALSPSGAVSETKQPPATSRTTRNCCLLGQPLEKQILSKRGYARAIVESEGTMRPSPIAINDVEIVLSLLRLTRVQLDGGVDVVQELVAFKLHESSNDQDFAAPRRKRKNCSVPPLRKRSTHGLMCDRHASTTNLGPRRRK